MEQNTAEPRSSTKTLKYGITGFFGRSVSGKTTLVQKTLREIATDKTIVFLVGFQACYTKLFEEFKEKGIRTVITHTVTDMILTREYDEEETDKIFVFEDDTFRNLDISFFFQARQKRRRILLIGQEPRCNRRLWLNMDEVFLMPGFTSHQLKQIHQNYTTDLTLENFYGLYRMMTSKPHSFYKLGGEEENQE